MRSSDNNLNNPMVVNTIDLYSNVNSAPPNVMRINEETYKLIKTKDPMTIYIVESDQGTKVYKGNSIIKIDYEKISYLLGPSNKYGEYKLYLNHDGNLIEICKFDDPNIAINLLNRYNQMASHDKLALKVYNIVSEYIKRNIYLSDMILGIISSFGYKDSPKLQDLIMSLNELTIHKLNFRTQNAFMHNDNHLYKIYLGLYDLVESYDRFKSRKFQDNLDNLDLSEIMDKIFNIMKNPE